MKLVIFRKKRPSDAISMSWTLVAALVICLVVARGVFELFLNKNLAYLVSLVPFLCGITILCLSRPKLERGWKSVVVVLSLILLTAIVSAATTAGLLTNNFAIPYLPFYLATPFLLVWGMALRGTAERKIDWPLVIALVGWFLAIVAVLEMLRVVEMPGGWFAGGLVRPAGPTGSKQHYSIAQAIVAVMCFQFYVWKHSKFQLVSFVFFSLMVLLSQGRSGILILMVGFSGVIFAMRHRKHFARLVIAVLLVFAIVGGLLCFTPVGEAIGLRLSGMFDTEEGANYRRLDLMEASLQKWSDTNLFVGEWFGSHTQVNTKVLGAQTAGITESSVIMTLLHTGLTGLIAYYLPFLLLFNYVRNNSKILASLVTGCFLQSFVYMSLEAVPFVALLGLLPVIYRNSIPAEAQGVYGSIKRWRSRKRTLSKVI